MQTLVTILADTTPEDSEVVAGPLGFAIWIFLILAVVVLGFSLVKQLRKAEAAKAAGLYGDEPVTRDEPEDGAAGEAPQQQKSEG
ncbi:hypothetical protein [Nocardioides okcheonensis]|uniref:hypothetical protein n=1 Tax=Nocardioides okcheonensis TaxID=2894081 RepID=UPI001E4AF697|nr:hypothetical protein [Nocardioides okcheonensis]UFN46229.1 hypothetical protein LN652_08515 [Nocardioides okcheonensis]